MASSSAVPATIETPLKDNGQNNRQMIWRSSSPSRHIMVSKGSSNSLNEQAGPVTLPPLHPSQSSARSSLIQQRTNSDYDNDSVSVMSTGSSVVPVDAGQHGFITYNDDASSTGSMVLAYEQGKDIPPAAYDLPASIFSVYNPKNSDERLVGEGIMPNRNSFNSLSVKTLQSSETGSVLLPYHVRTKLNASQNTFNSSESRAAKIPAGVKAPSQSNGYGSIEAGLTVPASYYDDDDEGQQQSTGYGSIEAGLTVPASYYDDDDEGQQQSTGYCSIEAGLAPPAGYYDNDDGGQQQNIAFDPSIASYENSYHSEPMCAPYEEPCIKYNGQNASVSGHSHQTQSSNGMIYVSMLIALVLFVVVVYAIFHIMKSMH